MKLLLMFVLLLGCAKPRIHDSLHGIVVHSEDEDETCSAYAIGPHALATAEHCVVGDKVDVDGKPAELKEVIKDGHDHVLLLLKGTEFKDYVRLKIAAAHTSDHVLFFGNPVALHGLTDQYREGYVAGVAKTDDGILSDVFVMPAIPGDSGSLIFNRRGEAVGMVHGVSGPFTNSYPIVFTKEQLKRAAEF